MRMKTVYHLTVLSPKSTPERPRSLALMEDGRLRKLKVTRDPMEFESRAEARVYAKKRGIRSYTLVALESVDITAEELRDAAYMLILSEFGSDDAPEVH